VHRAVARPTSSCGGPLHVGAGAAHVRHFTMHTHRAGLVVTRPLNCGVMRHGDNVADLGGDGCVQAVEPGQLLPSVVRSRSGLMWR